MATTGPGKSFFLYYVLLRRLSGKSPTAFQLSDRVIFFDEDGPLEFSGIPDGTLALADSTPNNKVPCQAFLSAAKAQVARVIQATSSAPENWKAWDKDLKANMYIMDYFSSEEINTLGFVLVLQVSPFLLSVFPNRKLLGLKRDVLQRLYNTWGPSARTCVQLAQFPNQEGRYGDEVKTAV